MVSFIQATPASNGTLSQDQEIRSIDGRYFLRMQSDGNLVLYWDAPGTQVNTAVWFTSTAGAGTTFPGGKPELYVLGMQQDGNLVVYAKTIFGMSPVWHTHTHQPVFDYFWLELRNDGNLIIFRGQRPKQRTIKVKQGNDDVEMDVEDNYGKAQVIWSLKPLP